MDFFDLTDDEVLVMIDYAKDSERSEERTKKVARLGRWLLWPEIAIRHGEDYAYALPDSFWELAYDRSDAENAVRYLLETLKKASK